MRTLLLALCALLFAGAARGQGSSAIREFDLATTVALGNEIYRHDSAAWVATDALRAKVKDLREAGVRGWVVIDEGTGKRVRFLRDMGQGPEAAYDVHVTADLKTSVSEPADRALTTEESVRQRAWATAAEALRGQQICRPGYNHVVLKDPQGEGWLVWWLAPVPAAGAMPMGGHYRFTVSADGRKVLRRDALSNSCGVLDTKAPAARGQEAAAFGVTHVVSATPVETHVFLQLQSGGLLYVMTTKGAWKLEGGGISRLDGQPRASP